MSKTPNQRLIDFMIAKKTLLPEKYRNKYFNITDAQALELLNKEIAQITVDKIIKSVYDTNKDEPVIGLPAITCPFCVYMDYIYPSHKDAVYSCSYCPYGKHHKECRYVDSDYMKITRSIPVKEIFTEKVYENLIKIHLLGG